MSDLAAELLLRLAKAGVALLLAALLYGLLTGIGAQPPSVPLALLCWLGAAAFILLVESSPL